MKKKFEQLAKLTYGCGVEHEMHIFHAPKIKKTASKPIRDVTLFDAFRAKNRLMKAYKEGKISLTDDDIKFLQSVPFEATGRLCNGEWVIKKVPVDMPEFITTEPFCNIKMEKKLWGYMKGTYDARKRFTDLILREPVTQKIVQKNGALIQYPSGMTRYLKCPVNGGVPNYRFLKKRGTQEEIVRPEYVGSYHVTFTLPHAEDISQAKFVAMHQNFANQLQWLEPLLLSSYFSQDQYACGSKEERVRGSFRVMIIGWGNLAGSDVRLFSKGIGRYAKTPTYWRKGFKLFESKKIKPCILPSPSALAEEAITSLSSDFRTFGSTDPNRPEHRESGVGMTKPNGIEFRIFDHFHDNLYLKSLVDLIGIVSENSRKTAVKKYVYKNKVWIENLRSVMRMGYRALITDAYVKLLREILGIPIRTTSRLAYDVFRCVVIDLNQKNFFGDWNMIYSKTAWDLYQKYHGKKKIYECPLQIPQINKQSYLLSFYMKMNRRPLLRKRFQKMNLYLSGREMKFSEMKKVVGKMMGKVWEKDAHDLVEYYLENTDTIATKHKVGTFDTLHFRKIPLVSHFNSQIMALYNVSDGTIISQSIRSMTTAPISVP